MNSSSTFISMVLALVMALAVLAMTPRTGWAQETTPEWQELIPMVSVRAAATLTRYRARACGCFDRTLWYTEVGLGARWHRFLELEGEHRRGGINVSSSGHVMTSAWAVGLRSALTPPTQRWWGGFFGRAGVVRLTVPATRQRNFMGLYFGAGLGLPLFGERVFLEQEVPLGVGFAELSHITIGLRVGLRVVINP